MIALKRLLSYIMVFGIFSSVLFAAAVSPGDIRVVLGEDLSESEISGVYRDFQLERGTVRELTVSNEEEYALLRDNLSASVIGSVACSSVCLRILPEGSGSSITTRNIAWCTEEMYKSVLRTAGIEDVSVIVSAPFAVSGTAALVGIYKAYEDMSGAPLSPDAKSIGAEELLLTGSLAEEIGAFDASLMVESLKGALEYTESLSDEELKERIGETAEQYRIHLNDTQTEQLMGLCRQLEKLDDLKLQEKVEEVKKTLGQLQEMKKKAEELQEKARDWRTKLEEAGQTVRSFYRDCSIWVEENSWRFRKLWEDVRFFFTDEEEAGIGERNG